MEHEPIDRARIVDLEDPPGRRPRPSNRNYRIHIDTRRRTVRSATVTGRQILSRAGKLIASLVDVCRRNREGSIVQVCDAGLPHASAAMLPCGRMFARVTATEIVVRLSARALTQSAFLRRHAQAFGNGGDLHPNVHGGHCEPECDPNRSWHLP